MAIRMARCTMTCGAATATETACAASDLDLRVRRIDKVIPWLTRRLYRSQCVTRLYENPENGRIKSETETPAISFLALKDAAVTRHAAARARIGGRSGFDVQVLLQEGTRCRRCAGFHRRAYGTDIGLAPASSPFPPEICCFLCVTERTGQARTHKLNPSCWYTARRSSCMDATRPLRTTSGQDSTIILIDSQKANPT